jgi:coenzyme F420-reducing hydrogenase delta subunit
MFNLSSGDAPLFARYAEEMAERIMELGPKPGQLVKSQTGQ